MIKTAAFLPADLNRLARESDMMLATVESLSDEELASASKCEGWTRAHVVAHIALGADAVGRLVNWAVTGEETPAYVSMEARNADIEALAKKSPAELKAATREATRKLQEAAERLRNGVKVDSVVAAGGISLTPYALPALRISEVIIHHADLDTLWELEEADIDALEDALDIVVERLNFKGQFPGVKVETDEGDEWVIGDGATTIKGGRDAVLGWLARGETKGVRTEGELPARPERAVG